MYSKPQDRYVRVGAVRTRYWTAGRQGPVVLLLHGIIRFVEDWLPTIAALAPTHRVYALDLVGYGRSDKPPATYSIDYLTAFVRDFMDTMGIEQASLVAHSLGGGIALYLAYYYPTQVNRLALVAPAGLGRQVNPAFRVAALPGIGELATHPRRLVHAIGLRIAFGDNRLVTKAAVDLSYEIASLPGAQAAFLSTIRAGATFGGLRPELVAQVKEILPTITQPTLLIWGRQDRVVPAIYASVALELLPGIQAHLLDPCGHFPQLEHPRQFNTILSRFLDAPLYRPEIEYHPPVGQVT